MGEEWQDRVGEVMKVGNHQRQRVPFSVSWFSCSQEIICILR